MRFCFFGGYEEWKLWQRMSRGFEAENPDVRMKLLYWPGNYEDKVRLVMAAGTAPDVLSAQDEPFPNYCQLGQYEDLTPYMERFRANTRPISSFRPRWRRSATIGFLLFSDLRTNEIKKWTPDGTVTTFRKPSGNSNGLTLDRQGRLIACEQGKRRVSRTEKGGTVVTLADRYNGKRLNSPNDAVVRSDGSIFFTDPPYGIGEDPELQELPFSGVFRLSPDGKLTLLADDFEGPNGLAFSPDEKTLYIDDTNRGHIRAFDVSADGTLANGRVFAILRAPGNGGADGMKLDIEGNIYCSGPGAVFVFDPSGKALGMIKPAEAPANVGWGDADAKGLYITARTGLYRIRLNIPGKR